MKKADIYKKIIRSKLNRHKIKVKKWFKTTDATALAYIEERMVCIPKPNSLKAFLICLHEIGHILYGIKKYNFLMEYDAEMYAIKEGMKYGFYSETYVLEAKKYVHMHLREDMNQENITINKVPKKVTKWIKDKN